MPPLDPNLHLWTQASVMNNFVEQAVVGDFLITRDCLLYQVN